MTSFAGRSVCLPLISFFFVTFMCSTRPSSSRPRPLPFFQPIFSSIRCPNFDESTSIRAHEKMQDIGRPTAAPGHVARITAQYYFAFRHLRLSRCPGLNRRGIPDNGVVARKQNVSRIVDDSDVGSAETNFFLVRFDLFTFVCPSSGRSRREGPPERTSS